MNYDLISSLRVEELKTYLKERGLKTSGRRVELVARVFAASENKVPFAKSAVEIEADLKQEYIKKLDIDGYGIPDPFSLEEGWLEEEEGRYLWPMVLSTDIFIFLVFHPSELKSDDFSDYKACKAYSYYCDGWLMPLQCYNISVDNPFCIIRGKCRKSQKVNDPYHRLRLVIEKKDRKILRGHCSCMAEMGQTCNHVAAGLFRMEAMVRLGLTNPSCTSKPNEWLPCRKEVTPMKVKDINFNRDDFNRRGRRAKSLISTPKKLFNPLLHSEFKLITLEEIAYALKDVSPNSIIHTAVPREEIDFVREVVGHPITTSISNIDEIIKMSESSAEFFQKLMTNMTEKNIYQIEKMTQGQSDCDMWFYFRKGVVTAYKFHNVLTKMAKISKGGGGYVDMFQLNQSVSGLNYVPNDLPALKYGRDMEKEAAITFLENMKAHHKNLKLNVCGMFLDKCPPFIGASPDRIFECDCCPPACVEINSINR